jgi:hypothetical protein
MMEREIHIVMHGGSFCLSAYFSPARQILPLPHHTSYNTLYHTDVKLQLDSKKQQKPGTNWELVN